MFITSNNPSLLADFALILLASFMFYELISAGLMKKRANKLKKIAAMIKDRHSIISNYKIKKDRERAYEEEINSVNDDYYNN